MTLTGFLMARICDDEAASGLDEWHRSGCETNSDSLSSGPCDCGVPARVLAECEAKRRIIHQHGAGEGHECPDGFMDSAETDPHTGWENDCQTLKFLALPYADHPDYRDEWKP